jgi:(2Fe-2S) ferredoxin
MHAIVDGHNAIGRLGITAADDAGRRRSLLARVARVTTDATVFFDAQGAPRLAPSVDREAGLAVRFSRTREADEEILAFVRGAANPAALLVVTDDRELAGRTRQAGAKTSGVAEFFASAPAPAAEEPRARASGGAGGRPMTAADFGLPPVIDLACSAQWLETPATPPGVEGPGGRSGPAAPPQPPVAAKPADPVEKARAFGANLMATRPTRHVLLCSEATKPKCAPSEVGRAAWEHLKQRVKDLGIDAVKPTPGTPPGACVLRTKVDCLRVCADGPIAVVYPDGVWYRGVTAPVMERILLEHVLGGKPVAEHVLATLPLPPAHS